MLGSLARWLRILGCEADYDSRADDKMFLQMAKNEGAVLLTRDEELYRQACSRDLAAVLVLGEKDEVRLGRLAKVLGLSLELDMARTRCAECGSTLHEISRSEASTNVPDTSLNLYDKFWRCTSMECGKTYWLGSHIDNIRQTLEKARLIMEKS
jgi:uncharacterized protein